MNPHNSSISSFKRFVRRLLLPYVATTAIIVFIAGYLFERKVVLGSSISGAYKVNKMIAGVSPEEIPLIGSSRAQGSYIPDSISPHVFNYGIDGTNMNVHLLLLEKELAKGKTSPVIINLDMEGFGAAIGDISNYLYNISDPHVYELVKGRVNHWQTLPVFKYYGYFEQYLKYYLNDRINLTKVTSKGGSFELNVPAPKEFERQVKMRRKTISTFQYDAVQDKKLRQLIRKHSNRSIIFVVAPYHSSYIESYNSREAFGQYIRQLEQYRNVHILDYSTNYFPDSCYFNTTHLNYAGARLFSAMVGDTLTQLNFFRELNTVQ